MESQAEPDIAMQAEPSMTGKAESARLDKERQARRRLHGLEGRAMRSGDGLGMTRQAIHGLACPVAARRALARRYMAGVALQGAAETGEDRQALPGQTGHSKDGGAWQASRGGAG